MKKIFNVVLSVCMLMVYSVPAFAYNSDETVKVELSDQNMAETMGAGAMDCGVVEYSASNGFVEAVVTNRSASSAHYDLDIVDTNGIVIESLVSNASLPNPYSGNSSILVRASSSAFSQNFARITLNSDGVPGLNCMHAIQSQ